MHISNTRFVHSISVQIFIYEFLSKQLDRRSFSRTLFTSSQRNDTSSNSKYSWSSDALSRWSQKLKERSPLLENVEFLFSILLFHGETTVHFQIIIGSIDLDQTPNLLIAKFHSRDDTQQRNIEIKINACYPPPQKKKKRKKKTRFNVEISQPNLSSNTHSSTDFHCCSFFFFTAIQKSRISPTQSFSTLNARPKKWKIKSCTLSVCGGISLVATTGSTNQRATRT